MNSLNNFHFLNRLQLVRHLPDVPTSHRTIRNRTVEPVGILLVHPTAIRSTKTSRMSCTCRRRARTLVDRRDGLRMDGQSLPARRTCPSRGTSSSGGSARAARPGCTSGGRRPLLRKARSVPEANRRPRRPAGNNTLHPHRCTITSDREYANCNIYHAN